jgi:sugar lactone lactonase YvrE
MMRKLYGGGHFFEGARWRDGYWWVSDLYARQVLKISSDGAATAIAYVEQQPSGLGWLADGTLLVVSMKDRRVLRLGADGRTSVHADIYALTGSLANDLVTDRRGHAYVTNLGFDLFNGEKPRAAALVHIAPDGAAHIGAEDLLFPNGLVVSADGKTLIVAETFGGRLTAFSIAGDGSLHERRVWARVGITPSWDSLETLATADIMPDGCAIDPEGCVWMADAKGGRVVRVAENAGIVDEVRAPEGLGAYSCALGGPRLDQLLICAAPDYSDVARKAAAQAELYTVDLSSRQ